MEIREILLLAYSLFKKVSQIEEGKIMKNT